MDIQQILGQLKDKFGDSFDVAKVTSALKLLDLKNLSLTDIISKLHADGLLANVSHLNLDSVKDSVKDSVVDGLKSKAGSMLGGLFGK
ncbi:MAG: hypothetical protein K2I92_03935 [Muribaculaceae bacterium]|nr:hypothetical protein [Muribaculaceae bacterium]